MSWNGRAAQIWFLERAIGYHREGRHPERARHLAECSTTWGSYRTVDGFRASVRACDDISEDEAIAEVEQLSEALEQESV